VQVIYKACKKRIWGMRGVEIIKKEMRRVSMLAPLF
jgi:hypothetical protein